MTKAPRVASLKFARDFNRRFPGFETDIHGLVKDESEANVRYYVDCVRQLSRPGIRLTSAM